MQIDQLPLSAQNSLLALNLQAEWFGKYFMRQANRIVEKASNDQN